MHKIIIRLFKSINFANAAKIVLSSISMRTQMSNRWKIVTVFFVLATAMFSCVKQEVYPVEPHIEYSDFIKIADGTGIDNKAYLVITFTDGDGDIGLQTDDTLPPYNANGDYYYNFLINYFEKQNDTFVEVQLPTTFNARIPYVEDNLAERGIRGEIQIELFYNNFNSSSDSIRFTAQIIDRALHKSNIITTPSIFVQK